jgi:phosphoribosylanthranilate isomerase
LIIQIYEIQTPEEAETICALGVDHVGSVILSADEWRDPVLRETVHMVQTGTQKSSLIPLFSEPSTIFKALDYYRPDIVHFCEMLASGTRGAAICHQLMALQEDVRRRYPEIAIMRSIPIGENPGASATDDLTLAEFFEPSSDFFLTDTVLTPTPGKASQPVEGFVGITGRTCHWKTAAELTARSKIPVILAGGLSPANVYEGIQSVRPAGVDSCTGTNQLDTRGQPIRFQKNMPRVRQFVQEARRAVADLEK